MIKGCCARLKTLFRLDQMSPEFLTFINAYFCFSTAVNLSNIFISTFLFSAGGEMSTIAMYHVFFYFCEILGTYLSVSFSHRISSIAFSVAGIALHLAAYLVLLIAQERTIHIYPVIGIVSGIGSGFYWIAYFTLIQFYTTEQNRQYGMSYSGLIGNLIILIAPSFSGIVLVCIPGHWGYMTVFGIAFLFFAWSVWIIRRLKSAGKSEKRRVLFPIIREFWRERVLNDSILCEFIRGLRSGLYVYYFNILIFSMTSNEFVLGLTSTIKGAAAMLIFYLLGRRPIRRKSRFALFFVASILGICVTSSLFFWYTAVAVVTYSVLDNSTNVIIDNYSVFTGYQITEYISRKRDLRMENAAIRLIALECGRITGIMISLLVPTSGKGIIVFFLVLGFLNLPVWWLYRRASKICEEGHYGNGNDAATPCNC